MVCKTLLRQGKGEQGGMPWQSPHTVQNWTIYTDLGSSRRNSLAAQCSKPKPQAPSPKHSGKMVHMPILWSRGASYSLSSGKWRKHRCPSILGPRTGEILLEWHFIMDSSVGEVSQVWAVGFLQTVHRAKRNCITKCKGLFPEYLIVADPGAALKAYSVRTQYISKTPVHLFHLASPEHTRYTPSPRLLISDSFWILLFSGEHPFNLFLEPLTLEDWAKRIRCH